MREREDGKSMRTTLDSLQKIRKPIREEDKIDKIMNMLQTMVSDINEMKNKQRGIRKEQKQYQQEILELKKECKN